MSWVKLTKSALYLMKSNSNCYVDKVSISGVNPSRLTIPLNWFEGRDVPGSMVIDLEGDEPGVCASPPTGNLQGKKIVLDPGHGEDGDPGALGQGRRNERDEVLKQANQVKTLLTQKGAIVEIVPNELNLPLVSIGARGAGADCFVSLHLNACNHSAQGHLILIDTNGTQIDQRFAHKISESFNQEFSDNELHNQGVRRQGLGVLRGVPLPVPAILVESFFIDSMPEGQLDSFRDRSAKAVAKGIEDFLTS